VVFLAGGIRGSNKMVKPESALNADPGFPNLIPGSNATKGLAPCRLLLLLLQEVLDKILVDRETEHLQLDVVF
jgi:hypothetical protein